VGTGVALAYGFYWLIGGVVGTQAAQAAPKIEVYRTALAGVAGIGGAVALVVAYRRQRDTEQGRFVERFGAAAAQLGHQDVAVRIAGVYAMAGVADESSTPSRRQQCIDVLCGYLRLPYDPEHGSSHRTEQVVTRAETPITSIEEHFTFRQNDREVRQTIVRVITAHLQRDAEAPWSKKNFDFTGVQFENADFSGATFSGGHTSFVGAMFSGADTSFSGARFSRGHTSFDGAMFSGAHTSFSGAMFSRGYTSFDRATFSGADTDFILAGFSGFRTSFDGATFSGERTSFGVAGFSRGYTSFDRATFSGADTSFAGARFEGGRASFDFPRAWNNVKFDWDESPADMPECVGPRDWPPTVVPEEESGGDETSLGTPDPRG
jgi:hypothetical protein